MRIPQNLGNKFAHEFATCTKPSTLGLEFEARVIRFVNNCRLSFCNRPVINKHSTDYWIKVVQGEVWSSDIDALKKGLKLEQSSRILSLNPFVDESDILRVGGRQENAKLSFDNHHLIIIPANHQLVKLLIRTEHIHLLHAGHLLTSAFLSRQYHIVGGHKAIRSNTCNCVTCRRHLAKPNSQLMGQLPKERVTPDAVFNSVGVDYASPLHIKQGSTRKPVIVKAYVCVFVSLSTRGSTP